MTASLVILDASQGDVTLTDESALCVSVQGTPAADFSLFVPNPAPDAALVVVNNPTSQTCWVRTAAGNPAAAAPGKNSFVLIDSAGNAQQLP